MIRKIDCRPKQRKNTQIDDYSPSRPNWQNGTSHAGVLLRWKENFGMYFYVISDDSTQVRSRVVVADAMIMWVI